MFLPIFENNKSPVSESEEEEKQVVEDETFRFANFNILIFAEEQIMQYARSPKTREQNRDFLYSLYQKALNIEPEPDTPELTFTQRMLANRA